MIRVLFLGTPDFAEPSLESLLKADRIEVVGVITQPDRPAGRGQHLSQPPIKLLAMQRGLPLLQPGRVRNNSEAHLFARQLCPDVMAVVAFGQILPSSFFEIPPYGALNVHASLLPRYRGAAPVAYTLLHGDPESGVTIMRIDEGMDTGDILAVRKVPVNSEATAGELSRQLALIGGELLAATIPPWVAGRIEPRPQNDEQASYAPRLDRSQAVVDWRRPAATVHNQIRAFNPWPVAVSYLRRQPIKLWTSRSPLPLPDENSPAPGTIIDISKGVLRVACGESSCLDLLELQAPGRRRMSALDFINGRQICVGERFHGAIA